MKFPEFVAEIDELVTEWNGPVVITDKELSQKLQTIYDEVRDSCAYELAQRERRAAAILHRHYAKEGEEAKNERPNVKRKGV